VTIGGIPYDGEPTSQERKKPLVLFWGELADPVVLAATLTVMVSHSPCELFSGFSHAVGAMLAISAIERTPNIEPMKANT
jgi:hypothetical protein